MQKKLLLSKLTIIREFAIKQILIASKLSVKYIVSTVFELFTKEMCIFLDARFLAILLQETLYRKECHTEE